MIESLIIFVYRVFKWYIILSIMVFILSMLFRG